MTLKAVAQSLEPFVDPVGDVFIKTTVDGKPEPEAIPLESRQGRAILRAMLCDVLKRGHPTEHETKIAVEVIYGIALQQQRVEAETSVEYAVARKPLAQVIIFLAQRGPTIKTPRQLLAAVNDVAIKNSVDTKAGPWPTSEDALGRQMSQLIDVLAKKDVQISKYRRDERQWEIRLRSPASDASDGHVSGTTHEPQANSVEADTSTTLTEARNRSKHAEVTDEELKTLLNGVAK